MKTEKRLIDANALLKRLRISYLYHKVKPYIDKAPTVVTHGEWEFDCACEPMCSVCGEYAMIVSNYCPNCGAKMDGEPNEEQTSQSL